MEPPQAEMVIAAARLHGRPKYFMQMLIHEGLGDEDLMMREAISMQMLIHEGGN